MTKISDMTPLVITSATGVFVPVEKTGSTTNYRVDIAAVMYALTVNPATIDTTFGGNVDLASGKVYKVNGTTVIDGSRNATLAATTATTVAATGAVSGASVAATGAVTGASVAATGAVTGASVAATGAVTSSSASAGVGYVTGAGGAVTQLTNKSTASPAINKTCGQVTMNNAALAAGAKVSFVVTNSTVAATDIPIVAISSGGTANAYRAAVTAISAGVSFTVTVENITAGSLSEAPVVNFAIIRGVSS